MTPAERRDPKILNGSRRSRIAAGSGTSVSDVNGLIERFSQAQKMMKQMGPGGLPGMPGMPGFPGIGGGKKAKGRMAKAAKPAKGKRQSGNPAKRASADQGAPDDLSAPPGFDPASLPKELRDLLN
jgi:signal recognition particle subunit SRP54